MKETMRKNSDFVEFYGAYYTKLGEGIPDREYKPKNRVLVRRDAICVAYDHVLKLQNGDKIYVMETKDQIEGVLDK